MGLKKSPVTRGSKNGKTKVLLFRKIRYLMSAACAYWNIRNTQERTPTKTEICKHGHQCGIFMKKIRFITEKIDALEKDDTCRSHFEIECIKNANGFDSELVSVNQKDLEPTLPLLD